MKFALKTGAMLQKIHLKSRENAVFLLTNLYNICYNNLHGKNAKVRRPRRLLKFTPVKVTENSARALSNTLDEIPNLVDVMRTAAFLTLRNGDNYSRRRKTPAPLYHSASFMVRDRFALSRHFFAQRQEKHIRSGFECSVIHLHTLMGLESPQKKGQRPE